MISSGMTMVLKAEGLHLQGFQQPLLWASGRMVVRLQPPLLGKTRPVPVAALDLVQAQREDR